MGQLTKPLFSVHAAGAPHDKSKKFSRLQKSYPEGKTCVHSPFTVSWILISRYNAALQTLSASKEYCCEQNQALTRNAPLSQTNGPSNSWQFSCCLGRTSKLVAWWNLLILVFPSITTACCINFRGFYFIQLFF